MNRRQQGSLYVPKQVVTGAPTELFPETHLQNEEEQRLHDSWLKLERGEDPSTWFVGWEFSRPAPMTRSASGCLQAFIGLASAGLGFDEGAKHVKKFVQRWGPLRLAFGGINNLTDRFPVQSWPGGADDGPSYIRLARKIDALLFIADNLRRNQRGYSADWENVFQDQPFDAESFKSLSVKHQRQYLAREVSLLMTAAELRPLLDWQVGPEVVVHWRGYPYFDNRIRPPSSGPPDGSWGFTIYDGKVPDPSRVLKEDFDEGTCWAFQAIVLQLVDAIENISHLRRCGNCRRWFKLADLRGRGDGERYCSQDCAVEGGAKKHRELVQRTRNKPSTRGAS